VKFGRSLRGSPYDPLLIQLRTAGAGKFLRFADRRARTSITARAKKLNIKVMFGEQGESLWVTLAAVEMKSNGHVEEQPARPSNGDLAIAAINAKRHTVGEILTWMRSNGADGLGITQVDGLIRNLARAGKIKLKGGRPGDEVERWVLA
jgi:hypothetical protein